MNKCLECGGYFDETECPDCDKAMEPLVPAAGSPVSAEDVEKLKSALADPIWLAHKIGDTYRMKNAGAAGDDGWKIAYYPLFGTYKGQVGAKKYEPFSEPRALVEKAMKDGTDFREVPLKFLTKENDQAHGINPQP